MHYFCSGAVKAVHKFSYLFTYLRYQALMCLHQLGYTD